MKYNNILDIYTEPSDILSHEYKSATQLMGDCIYILDTNVLLLPYTIGSKELKVIENVYKKLEGENRIFIPEQVIKEFAKNRPNKLTDMYKVVSDYLSTIGTKPFPQYKMLIDTDEYKNVEKAFNEYDKSVDNYKNAVKRVLSYIQKINWDDKVSEIYKKIFTEKSILSYGWAYNDIQAELEERHKLNIPPANKDKAKDDKGIGDFIIWKDILETGLKLNKNIIFITGDEKPDWFHQSNGSKLYPRFELSYEFSQYTKGHDVTFISLSTLIDNYSDDKEIVNIIKNTEEVVSYRRNRISSFLRKLVLNRAGNKCESCGGDFEAKFLEIHHINHLSLSKDGENELENIMVLCPDCHKLIHDNNVDKNKSY